MWQVVHLFAVILIDYFSFVNDFLMSCPPPVFLSQNQINITFVKYSELIICCYDVSMQVRVHVIEARRILASGAEFLVRVAIGNDVQDTSSRRGTSKMFFDEVSYTLMYQYVIPTIYKGN